MFMHVIKKVKSYFKVEVSLAYTVSSHERTSLSRIWHSPLLDWKRSWVTSFSQFLLFMERNTPQVYRKEHMKEDREFGFTSKIIPLTHNYSANYNGLCGLSYKMF